MTERSESRLGNSTLLEAGSFLFAHWMDAGSVSTLLRGLTAPSWRDAILRSLVDAHLRGQVPARAVLNAMTWLRSLPPSMPIPHVTVSTDETISVEWDRRGN